MRVFNGWFGGIAMRSASGMESIFVSEFSHICAWGMFGYLRHCDHRLEIIHLIYHSIHMRAYLLYQIANAVVLN